MTPPNFAPGSPIFLNATVVEQHAEGAVTVEVLGERRTVPYSALAGGTGGVPARTTAFAVVVQVGDAEPHRVVVRRGGFGQVDVGSFNSGATADDLAARINRVLDVANRVTIARGGEPEVVVGQSQESTLRCVAADLRQARAAGERLLAQLNSVERQARDAEMNAERRLRLLGRIATAAARLLTLEHHGDVDVDGELGDMDCARLTSLVVGWLEELTRLREAPSDVEAFVDDDGLVTLRRGGSTADVLWGLPLRVAAREARRLNRFLGHRRAKKTEAAR